MASSESDDRGMVVAFVQDHRPAGYDDWSTPAQAAWDVASIFVCAALMILAAVVAWAFMVVLMQLDVLLG